jgi:glycosyltransferase involved in cell wall biosynthesis
MAQTSNSNIEPLLSVLIPTINGRETHFNRITTKLSTQINKVGADKVQLLFYKDKRGEHTTGHKRNVLLEQSTGKFVVFVDDDDDVSPDYIVTIVNAIQNHPNVDAIGINGMYTDASHQKPFETGKRWNWDTVNGYYVRFVNHISPIRREHAIKIKFPDKTIGEDYEWTMALKQSGLIKKDFVIKKMIYYYDYVANKTY